MVTRIIIIFESIIFPLIADLSREVGRFENPAYESTGWVSHSVLTNMLLTMHNYLWNPTYESTGWLLASALMNTLLTIDDCENVSDIFTKDNRNNYTIQQ